MKLNELMNKTFKVIEEDIVLTNDEIINEGIWNLTPFVAFFALKDDVINGLKNNVLVKNVEPVASKTVAGVGNAGGKIESIKAKAGIRSGKGENATVYEFTKEQRKFLYEIYKKYGKEIYKYIIDFRNNVMAPYQIIKRNVAYNKKLTDKEVNGMTKEEYEASRESGRKKIIKLGTVMDASTNSQKETNNALEAYQKLLKEYNDFKNGKISSINNAEINNLLDSMDLGISSLKNWPVDELDKTYQKIKEYKNLISNGRKNAYGGIIVSGRGKNQIARSVEEINKDISDLEEMGITKFTSGRNAVVDNGGFRKGKFSQAYATYVLRKNTLNDIRSNNFGTYKDEYLKLLKTELKAAQEKKFLKLEKNNNVFSDTKFTPNEKKIWGLKITGIKNSGKLSDWYLKIKPEDFKGTKYYAKPKKVVDAENEIDRQVKIFQRKLEKTLSPEDMDKVKKYRLVNNFITFKELKDPTNLFKDTDEIEKDSGVEGNNEEKEFTAEDMKKRLDELKRTNYSTILALEKEQDNVRNTISKFGSDDRKDLLEYGKDFLNRTDPSTDEKSSRSESRDFNALVEVINNDAVAEYTNLKNVKKDLKDLMDGIADFKNNYPESNKLEALKYSIDKAKSNLNSYISSLEDNEDDN